MLSFDFKKQIRSYLFKCVWKIWKYFKYTAFKKMGQTHKHSKLQPQSPRTHNCVPAVDATATELLTSRSASSVFTVVVTWHTDKDENDQCL